MLNWFYDQSLEGGIELKATCAPHYFRVARQRRVADRKAAQAAQLVMPSVATDGTMPTAPSIGPTEIMMPGSTGIEIKGNGHPHSGPHAGAAPHAAGHPSDMNATTKGCLAGTGVCFVSHKGEVFPCGYLPALAGDLRTQSFAEIWEHSAVFNELRNTGNLKGKCGCCEFRNICMGCRARAFAATGDYMSEEPFCVYQPKMANVLEKNDEKTIAALR